MKTNPLYLDDPYKKSMETQIMDVIFEKEDVYRLILEETVFYPMGGGQPTDQGTLTFEHGVECAVYQVLMKDGEINHYVKASFIPEPGQKVCGLINWDRRYKNMKVHSAGHIVDFAVYLRGHSPKTLQPVKGDHGKKPFILYSGSIEKSVKDDIQKTVNEIIQKNLKFTWSFETLEDIRKEAVYLQPNLPANKPLRALRLESIGVVADGGTMVSTTSEVGEIEVLAIESTEMETKIHYALK